MNQANYAELTVRILKEDTCPSLSGRSLLTYQIGCTDDSTIHVRVHQNTGKGYFNREWIAFATAEKILGTVPALTANSFRGIFAGKSVNSAGFLMAVLKHLGLITPLSGNQRCYAHTGSQSFINEAAALAASPVSLPASEAQGQVRKGTPKLKAKGLRRSPVES